MNLFQKEYWLNARNLGKPKDGYSDLVRIKQWCGNYSELIAPKEIANFASAFALLVMPELAQNSTAVFGCVSEEAAVLELPFSSRKALTQWLAELAKQA